MIDFDHDGVARLAEDPGRGEEKWSALELQRHKVAKLVPRKEIVTYSLTIFHGDDDMSFSGMSSDQLRALGQNLIALADAAMPGQGAIPDNVYYAAEADNFYDATTRIGLGVGFWNAWHARAGEFPTKPKP